MRKHFDAQVAHSDNIWRSGAGARSIAIEFLNQASIVIWHHDANAKCASNEEYAISPVRCFKGTLHGLSRVDCLTSDHRQVFRPNNGEGGLEKSTKEPLKSTESPLTNIGCKTSWFTPVSEAIGIMLGITADHCIRLGLGNVQSSAVLTGDECEHENNSNEQNLARGEPELALTVPSDSEDVQ